MVNYLVMKCHGCLQLNLNDLMTDNNNIYFFPPVFSLYMDRKMID